MLLEPKRVGPREAVESTEVKKPAITFEFIVQYFDKGTNNESTRLSKENKNPTFNIAQSRVIILNRGSGGVTPLCGQILSKLNFKSQIC